MANLAKILYGFGEYSIWMQNMAPSRLAIMTKMANGEDSENWTAMANPVKKTPEGWEGYFGKDGIFGKNGKYGEHPPKS